MAAFPRLKGFKQATQAEYESTGVSQRAGYIWFVRDFVDNDEKEGYLYAKIYLGNRLYADSNEVLSSLMMIDGDDVY